jgi:F420-0:gamma-glutamyl ligase
MLIRAIKTRVFNEGEGLVPFIGNYIKKLEEGSVLVVTSKIVSLSERRTQEIENERTRERIIKAESQWAMHTKYTWLTIKDNTVMSSAGVDESNADGKIILLPRDSFAAAEEIRRKLKKHYKVKKLGIVISDSRLLPLRAGIVGVALGYAGFGGVRDYRGTPDIFGRTLKLSRTDLADSLATAAVVLMGEGAERQPLAVITDAPVVFKNKIDRKELFIDPKDDIYRPLFENIRKIKWVKKRS